MSHARASALKGIVQRDLPRGQIEAQMIRADNFLVVCVFFHLKGTLYQEM